MKDYDAYDLEAKRLCRKVREKGDAAAVMKKMLQMQEKVRQANLTVYQKDFLMQQLRSTSEAVHV